MKTLLVFICFITLLHTQAYSQDERLNRPPIEREVNYSPENGAETAVNPPAFIWLPVEGVDSYTVQYSRSRSFAPKKTITIKGIDMTVHTPEKIMEPGTWYWRFGYSDNGENRYSKTRQFLIPESAVHFPFIPVDEFMARIPNHRPRLYISPDKMNDIRNDKEGRYSHIILPVINEAEKILTMNEPLFEEPKPWEEYGPDFEYIYRKIFNEMRPYTQRMLTSAQAYLYTGDHRFADEAKRRLMHFMTWDIEGPSSTIWPTELGMDIAENAPVVFDWIYDTLSKEELEICIEVLTARMQQINRDVHRSSPMDSQPFGSHPGRMLGFAIEGGMVLAHEVPEARDWLDYSLKILWSTYPAWGGTDGGWQEGVHYWSGYMSRMVRLVNELDYYGISLKSKPFFQNTGYFGLYTAYIDRPTSAFGDEYHRPAGTGPGGITYMLSNLYKNPYFRWHAEQLGRGPSGRMAMRTINEEIESRSPSGLPQSRAFFDVGIVAMHSRMAEPENNVLMLFQSNPYGVMSHNHANQNAFVIEAFKEPLAISSGFRQGHGTPHHRNWVWQTKAHNSILVDNEGQVPRQRSSRGKIIEYHEKGDYVYTAGDATEAYGKRLKKFHRHILFVRPDYFVVIDDLQTSGKPSTYQWLLHARKEMEVDNQNNIMVSKSGESRLTARFLQPGNLELSQRTGFDTLVESPESAPDQFHFMATTDQHASSQRFVTVIWVDKNNDQNIMSSNSDTNNPQQNDQQGSQDNPLVTVLENKGISDKNLLNKVLQNATLLDAKGGIALRVGNDLILWREEDNKRIRAAGTSSRERMEVKIGFFNP